MNKLFTRALLALSVLTLAAAPSFAWGTFGLFPHCGHCCNKCNFCVRPYNAFSPVCSGTICCDGCFPFGGGYPGGGGCSPALNYSGFPACCQGSSDESPVGIQGGTPSEMAEQSCAPAQTPWMAQAPSMYPAAMQTGAGYPMWNAAMPYNPMQPARYQQPYYPGSNYGQVPMNVPAYWNAGPR
jgi:hypothetical protein